MRALVLVSGGLDSTVALWWAQHEGFEPVALTVNYPGRPRGEARAARDIVARAAVEAHEVDLPFLVDAADADARAGTHRFEHAPPGYVPGRNALLYAFAMHQAHVHDCPLIVGGHNAEDAARFPDVDPAYFQDLEALLHRGLWHAQGVPLPRLHMPLLTRTRDEVVALGESLGAPLLQTWSCYEDGEAPCGVCPACVQRRAGEAHA